MSPALRPPGAAGPGDLRTVWLGGSAWAGGLAVLLVGTVPAAVAGGAGLAGLAVRWRWRRGFPWLSAGCWLAFAAVAGAAGVGAAAHRSSPVAELAADRAWVRLTAAVVSDPLVREGRFGPFVVLRLRTEEVTGRGRRYAARVPVLVLAEPPWRRLRLGDTIRATGRLAAPDSADLAAVLHPTGSPEVLDRPGPLLDGAEAVRDGIRQATDRGPPDARALVPALVVGDDREMSPEVVADFRTTGLTHLAAVSGTNLTLVVGALLVAARAAGVRARGLIALGVLGVVGFVLLARTEPSVLRAAAMGTIALLGLGPRGRDRGVRALGVAVLVLLLADPWLAVSWGFALSVTATAGILALAPALRDALTGWLPRWAAEAVAVPFAAQLAVTPLLAVLAGEVSLVAVPANLLVAAAVAPATVLGLAAGLLHLLLPVAGAAVGYLAVAAGWWIIAVATRLARLPAAAVDWPDGPGPVLLLVLGCVLVVTVAPRLLRARRTAVPVLTALAGALCLPWPTLVTLPSPGWPPPGWLLVACDVGQGDALVLAAGPGRAVVVDAGPDPAAVDRCLDRLDVHTIPVVVLTHFHADHVDGLPGVLGGRSVGEVVVSPVPDPPEAAAVVAGWAADAGVPLRTARLGETGSVGPLEWQVLGPARVPTGAAAEGAANDASVVLLARSHGVTALATGDVEEPGQQLLRRTAPGLRADVLKVPHHGSPDQHPELLTGLGARLALVSVGADNGYGHPAVSTLRLLEDAGMLVRRTDLDGDLAVLLREGRLHVDTRR